MKITRFKKAQKTLAFYRSSYGFTEPYQILADGTFCLLALKMKVNLREQMPKYLGAECDLLTTQCCLHETENLGPELRGALLILQQFTVTTCGHAEKPLPASACLDTMCRGGNAGKFFIASQDQRLQDKLRKRPSVPILYLHHQSLTLEKPSDKAVSTARTIQNEKLEPTEYQKEVLQTLKKRVFGETPSDVPKKRKRGPKQPNPLSCKKSKKSVTKAEKESNSGSSKKRRKHKRLKMSDELKNIHEKLIMQTDAKDE